MIKTANNEITIEPASPGAKTKVNGMPLTGERVLKHYDRILFGKPPQTVHALQKLLNSMKDSKER